MTSPAARIAAVPSLPRPLDPVEIRVLGSLLEKQQATPEYYPLTLHALVAACNQKSNREPVMELSEKDALAALDRLREFVYVWQVGGSRAEKWEQNVEARWQLDKPAKALMTLLLLRGPQTPGELRQRSERLHAFGSLEELEGALARMASAPEPLVKELPRRPGQKESRFTHLAGGPVVEEDGESRLPPTAEPITARVERLEERVASLAAELSGLKKRLGE